MGRPLPKRFFGADANSNLKVQFHNGTESVRGYIVKQKASKKFLCKDENGNEALCLLVDKASADLEEGEMSITVLDDNGDPHQITKISRHRVSYNGGSMPWTFEENSEDGFVQVEEAGTDEDMTDATDLEGDDPAV